MTDLLRALLPVASYRNIVGREVDRVRHAFSLSVKVT